MVWFFCLYHDIIKSGDIMRKVDQLYEVEIKSKTILKEGKKSFITYFRGGNKKTIASNVRFLYPQYTKEEDMASVFITPITEEEYQQRVDGGIIKQKKHLIEVEGNVI
jgi:energy-converting hydrogenase Eha subunit F